VRIVGLAGSEGASLPALRGLDVTGSSVLLSSIDKIFQRLWCGSSKGKRSPDRGEESDYQDKMGRLAKK
jgi:hypothetical protein